MSEIRSDLTPLPVAVFGAYGRMGVVVCEAVRASPELRLVAAVGRDDPRELAAEASVVVDFTHPDAVLANARWALDNGKHLVIGTTGFDDARLSTLRTWLAGADPGLGVFVVPNFSQGALLAARFAAAAAPYFERVEIVDLTHDRKAEAPSGTATETARGVAQALAAATRRSPAAAPPVPEAPDAALIEGVPVHSVRMRGLVSHQTVLLGNDGEVLHLRFDTYDRAAFVPGVLQAVRTVRDSPGLHLGLGSLYDLDPGPRRAAGGPGASRTAAT